MAQPCKCSGAIDLGDDGHRIRRTRLRRVPPELEGSSARYLISLVSKPMRRAAARQPFLLRLDFRLLTQIRDADSYDQTARSKSRLHPAIAR